MDLLIWDFDGVIVDSLVERAIVAHLTYQAYKRGKVDIWNVSEEEINLQNSSVKQTIDWIRKKRAYLVPDEGGSKNFLEQLILLNDYDLDFNTLDEFLRAREKISDLDEIGKRYRELFFSLENYLFETFKDKWALLTSFYEGIKEKFVEMEKLFDCYICSSSERSRISHILEYNGIDFDPDHIFSIDFDGTQETTRAKRTTKVKNVRSIIGCSNSNQEKVHYIDDEVSQTLIMRNKYPNMKIYLATWGYVPNGWEELIRNTGITPVYLNILSQCIQSMSK